MPETHPTCDTCYACDKRTMTCRKDVPMAVPETGLAWWPKVEAKHWCRRYESGDEE